MRQHLAALALLAAVPAQTFAWSPAGSAAQDGNVNSTIPFWSASATYQQVHDAAQMQAVLGDQPRPLAGLAFRADAGATVAGRTLSVQVTVGATPVTAAQIGTSFAANLGPAPTTVLPSTPISFPNLASRSVPNPAGIVVPWPTPWTWTPGQHLCWEWRHARATSISTASMDAVNATAAMLLPNEGAGCHSPSQSQPATIELRTLNFNTSTYRARVANVAPDALAVLALGVARTSFGLPGQCAPLRTVPIGVLYGRSDGSGRCDISVPLPTLRGRGQIDLLGQFLWVDPGLPLGLGVSDLAVLRTALRGSWFVARAYTAPLHGGSGHEHSSTAASTATGMGLVVGFVAL